MPPALPIALTIAGFDPSSGAGLTADLKTFAAHGVYGTACATALTIQSTRGVFGVQPIAPDLLKATLDALEDDLPPAGIKIGMLANEEIVTAVCGFLEAVHARRSPPLVILDPVLRSSSGTDLLTPLGQTLLRDRLLPLCTAVTPNRTELASLTGHSHLTEEELVHAARHLQPRIGGKEIVVTGGDASEPVDLVIAPEGSASWLRGCHIESRATHGTGCAFSSALLSRRLLGEHLLAAARAAKHYVERTILAAPPLGAGRGPLQHLWPLFEKDASSP